MMEQNQSTQPPVFNQPQAPQQPLPPFQPRVTEKPMLNPIEAIKSCLKNYVNFKGRARRSEFWWFFLSVAVVSSILSILGMIVPLVGFLSLAFSLLVILPHLAVLTRRLHDSGHSGWWVVAIVVLGGCYYGSFLTLIGGNLEKMYGSSDPMVMAKSMTESMQSMPGVAGLMGLSMLCSFVLFIIIFVFTLQDSKWGTNKYGPSPKYS